MHKVQHVLYTVHGSMCPLHRCSTHSEVRPKGVLRDLSVKYKVARWMRVALESQDGRISYASATFYVGSSDWRIVNATLSPLETDDDARLGIAFQGPGDLADTLLYSGARHVCLKSRVRVVCCCFVMPLDYACCLDTGCCMAAV